MMPLQPLWWEEVRRAQKMVAEFPDRMTWRAGTLFSGDVAVGRIPHEGVATAICRSYNLFITLVTAVTLLSRKLKDRREPKGSEDCDG